ncbi:MAG: hypothetical protein ABSG65_34515 [Bryobacteraceae bacterium]
MKTVPVGSERRPPAACFVILALLVCLITLIVFFREFLQSGFNLIAGDVGDNRFYIAILEHLRAVIHGEAPFTSPNFFWPEHGVLGYSDSMFLMGLPYIIARLAGFDGYLAFEMAFIVFKAAGFFSMLWLLRSVVGVGRPVALTGSALFTLSNLYFVSMGHSQLATVVFTPLLAALACSACREYEQGRVRVAYAYGVACGILTAVVLFTSFYIGWFTILVAAGCLAVAALAHIIEQRSVAPVSEWLREAFARRWLLGAAALAFIVAIVPFLVTYLPALKHTGGRAFEETLLYGGEPVDLINVGSGNWMWGRALQSVLGHPFAPGEKSKGWPPVILLLTMGGALVSIIKLSRAERADPARHRAHFLIAVFGAAFLCIWGLSIHVGRWSLWWLVFKLVPGGSAIRAPARLNLVLNVLLILSACLVLEQLRCRRNSIRRVILPSLAVLLVAEQLNIAHTHAINRAAEKDIMGHVKGPPAECSSFFFTAPARAHRPFFANQIDAMLVARAVNLPTINGYSGWFPLDWNLLMFDNCYVDHVQKWAITNHIEQGLCGLDLQTGSWAPANFDRNKDYSPGGVVDFRTGGNALHFEGEGWGDPELGGSWTVGGHSVLVLQLPAPPTSDLVFSIEAHAFTPPQRNHFDDTVMVNGRVAAQWTITDREPLIRRHVSLPVGLIRSRVVRIEFMNHDPRSPADLGLSVDTRKVGLAIHTMRLDPTIYSPGEVLDFRSGGNGRYVEGDGWGDPEPGGSWTVGGHSILVLHLPAPPTSDLVFSIEAHAFTPPQRNHFDDTVMVNGRVAAQWTITDHEPLIQRQVRLPAGLIRSPVIRIEFANHDPRSPADLGLSVDARKVGLAIHTLRLDPTIYSPGEVLDFRTGGNGRYFEGDGWGDPEPGGSWTVGGRSVLLLPLAAPPASDLLLSIEAHAFTAPQRSRFEDTLLVNGHVAARWSITDREPLIQRQVRLAARLVRSRLLRIEFINHDPRSPSEVGLSKDARKIGLAIQTLRLDATAN